METRIKAMNQTFSLMLRIIEFLVGLKFLVKIIESDFSFGWLGELFSGSHYGRSNTVNTADVGNPMSFLLFVLGIMIFAYIMIMLLPGFIEKKERKMRMVDRDAII